MRDETTPKFELRINRVPLSEDLQMRIGGIEFEDAEHMDRLSFTIDNRARDIPADFCPMGATVRVQYGWVGDLSAPRYCIANRTKGWLSKEFVCLGVEQIVNGEPHSKEWTDVTLDTLLGDVVYKSMGLEYETPPERTDNAGRFLRYSYTQPNIPDMTFLYNLGRFIGYELWMEEGKIYFEPRRYWKKSYMEYTYQGPEGKVLSFEPEMNFEGMRGKFRTAGIDLEDNAAFDVTEEGTTRRMYFLDGKLFDAEAAMAKTREVEEAYWIMQPFFDKEGAEDGVAGAWVNAMEDQITAKLRVRGEPHLKARRVITVSNVDEFTGNYYVKAVRHRIGGGGYETEADLTRNALTDEGQIYSRGAARTLINKAPPKSAEELLNDSAVKPEAAWVKKLLGSNK